MVYAVALYAKREMEMDSEFMVSAAWVVCASRELATQKGLECAKMLWPVGDGWRHHRVLLAEIDLPGMQETG